MEFAKFKKLITLLGYPTEEWFRPTDIREIGTDNNGLLVISPNTNKIMISLTDQCIYYKESILVHQSDILVKPTFIDSKNVLIKTDRISPYKHNFNIRKPKAGDYIKICDANGDDLGVSSIISSVRKFKGVTGYIYELSDENIYNKIKSLNRKAYLYCVLADVENLIIPFDGKDYLVYSEKEYDNKEADYGIGISAIYGFEYTLTPENTLVE